MKEILTFLGKLWETYIWQRIEQFSFWDGLDILLLTILLYGVYLFFRGRRAGKLAVGLAVIFALYAISDVAGLRAIRSLLAGIAPFTVILLAVIFQNDIRDVLERLGSTPLGFFMSNKQNRADLAHTVSEVVDAACQIAMSDKDGALIVIERTTPLGDYIDKGQPMDAIVTAGLLRNIFVDRTPLHDGAVIISKNRIAAAGSKLPLSANEDVVRGLGTRHRAAVGITDVSDCVVVVVSEEQHVISIANHGRLKRGYNRNAEELRNESSLKAAQNQLRNDLFLLLAGTDYEEQEASGKERKKHRREKSHIHFRFKWKRSDADDDT